MLFKKAGRPPDNSPEKQAERREKYLEYQRNYYRRQKLGLKGGVEKKVHPRYKPDKPVDEMSDDEFRKYSNKIKMREYRAKNIDHIREQQRAWERKNRLKNVYRTRATADELKFSCVHKKIILSFD